MRKMHLRDITDIEILQEIQDGFARSTGLAAVTVDYKGRPVTEYSNFSRFCKLIREEGKCREACHRSDAYGGLEAARKEKPYIYRCHTGLVDFAIPIIINGQYMGSIMAGQVKIEEGELSRLDHIINETNHWKDNEEIMEAYNEIPLISYDKISGAAQMMFLVSNYMVEKDVMRLMQEELNVQNLKLMEEVKVRAELEKALKDTEIKALQSQVNPHFLFNVLNTVGRLALIEKAPKTQEIVHSLAEILRYVLKSINKLVELKDEIDHIERYLKIQSVRFGERIQYKIDIPNSLHKILIPSMILQSLVENSINHGLEPKEEYGNIKITGYAYEDEVIIEISDDGIGIPKDRLKMILDEDKDIEGMTTSIGIGINNVNKRLTHHYGPEYKIEIKSKLEVGTTVKVRIPKKINSRRALHV
ncbi:sensor histidine kinase [Alkaliphilus peptidifermentans]|uniref:histidine kinase n=1 Tax=Alkaliphilus peptidifermentans DSM 18978 TaxID=1120976 RepID=A0A1G5ABF8_9FIRM|nr:PocR ligand-binding domain-containing protein [Alkaliphilus peptidifermentans]SCX75196.1 Histidine kinase-, DNA gyrase B-, and HSP90-like ATPase [Alkaliphilus peptidifermentans DSM 18978]